MVLRLFLSIYIRLELQARIHLSVQISHMPTKEMVLFKLPSSPVLMDSQNRTRIVSRNCQESSFSPMLYTPTYSEFNDSLSYSLHLRVESTLSCASSVTGSKPLHFLRFHVYICSRVNCEKQMKSYTYNVLYMGCWIKGMQRTTEIIKVPYAQICLSCKMRHLNWENPVSLILPSLKFLKHGLELIGWSANDFRQELT